jgi:hypothetical protein
MKARQDRYKVGVVDGLKQALRICEQDAQGAGADVVAGLLHRALQDHRDTDPPARDRPSGQHTSGRWFVNEKGNVYAEKFYRLLHPFHGSDGRVITDHHEGLIALPYSCGDGSGTDNAHLIAKAPGLYQLAQHIVAMADDAYLTGHPEWLEIVSEAQKLVSTSGTEGK